MTPSRAFPWVLALVLLALGLALGLLSKAQAQPPVPHPVAGREQCLLCHGPGGGATKLPDNHAGRPVSTCLACHPVAIASPTATPQVPTPTATPLASPTAEPAPGEATPLPPTPTATATPSPTPEPTRAGGNQLCLACHQSPGLSFALPSGEKVSAQVDPTAFAISAHRRFQCSYCHEDKASYPHSEVTEPDFRTYRAARAGLCADCHGQALAQWQTSAHGRAQAVGNQQAALCTDCHDAHQALPLTLPKAQMKPCATCHPGADANFASGWLGYEEPSRRHFPWVYVIERFLFYLTTSVIAFGIVHVELDLLRWWVNKRRKKA